MVQINFASREVNCKIVYYGPGRSGKTTNLQVVHAKAPPNSTGQLISIATQQDRTLYFDFLPLDLGTVAGMRTRFQLYTVPGQVFYDATRKLVLQGADGVVFVADSNPDMMAENIESLQNLEKNLRENGLDINDIPVVLQWNKRDLPNATAAEKLGAELNWKNWPAVEAVAINGAGVFQTLKVISQLVIRKLNREQGYSEDGQARVAPPPKVAVSRPVITVRPGAPAAAPPPPAVAAQGAAPSAARAAPPPPPPPAKPRAAAAPPWPRPVAMASGGAGMAGVARAAAAAPVPTADPSSSEAIQKLNPVALELQRIKQRERERQAREAAVEAAVAAAPVAGRSETRLTTLVLAVLLILTIVGAIVWLWVNR